MKSLRALALGGLLSVFAAAACAQVGIVSEGKADPRIPIAIPDFCTAPGQEALGREMAGVLAQDLEFSGLFSIVPAQQYPKSFGGFTRDATKIDFESWRSTKAEFIVHVYVTSDATGLAAECRLFDVFASQQVVGKRLAGADTGAARLVTHQFADEIVLFLTGTPGCASSEICFSGGQTGKKEIYISDYDGANARQITQHNSISILPRISPDGRKIAYLSYKDRYPFLYILDRQTGSSTALSKEVGLNVAPSWSPDGTKLAIVQSKDGNSEIYVVNADGSNRRRLTNEKALDTSPCFSPDGNQIAFVSERAGVNIYVMNADGSNVRRLSTQGGRAYDPVWSPDGRKIAYVVEKSGEGFEVYVMNADGSGSTRLTNSTGSNERPSWSPDSRHVIFASSRSGNWELGAVNVETGLERRIPVRGLSCQGPSWGPRREALSR